MALVKLEKPAVSCADSNNTLMRICKDLSLLSLYDFSILDDSNYKMVLEFIERMKHTRVHHISGRVKIHGLEPGRPKKANPLEPWHMISYIERVSFNHRYKSGRITVKHREPCMDYLRIHDPNNNISTLNFPIETTHFRFTNDYGDENGLACFTLYDWGSDKDIDEYYSLKFFGLKPIK